MTVNLTDFTHEYLSSLKFKDLQKLSVQFHVNKRWAKKQDLIENLLALKESNIDNKAKPVTNGNEEKEWKDGCVVFNDPNIGDVSNRRLTFNVTTKSEIFDSRFTFDVPQNGKNLLDANGVKNFVLRSTYILPDEAQCNEEPLLEARATFEIPPKEKLIEEKVDPRATFEIPPKEKLIEEKVDPRATFEIPQNKTYFQRNNMAKIESKGLKTTESTKIIKVTEDLKTMNGTSKGIYSESTKKQTHVKMLTVPFAKITKRSRKDKDESKSEHSSIKMSKKSINIKKSTRQSTNKMELVKSPALSSLKRSAIKPALNHSVAKFQAEKFISSKIPTKLQFDEEKQTNGKSTFIDESVQINENKENTKKILRRKSKTADEVLVKKSSSVKVSFMSPPVNLKKNSKICPALKKTPVGRKLDGKIGNETSKSTTLQTPNFKPSTVMTTKAITAKKMPDFNKIHQKQFEQMDSLHDYLKKKEERSKRLFGTPHQASQSKVPHKSIPVFQFKSETKLDGKNESLKGLITPFKKKDTNAKAAQKEAFRNKLPPTKIQTELKDKNRSQILGVRTNKRFELQMKFRNM